MCVCDSLEVYVLLGSHSLIVDEFFVVVKAYNEVYTVIYMCLLTAKLFVWPLLLAQC